ncbi:MAG: hypothetical protein JWP35_2619 [Caulobacter sp.]|nr:hypothetical protein [Caulobacter sp.]
MADGEMIIKLDDATISALDAKARAAGLTRDDYARSVIQEAVGVEDRWAISRARLAEYDRTGKSFPAEQVFDEVEAMMAERLAKHR